METIHLVFVVKPVDKKVQVCHVFQLFTNIVNSCQCLCKLNVNLVKESEFDEWFMQSIRDLREDLIFEKAENETVIAPA